ncbi:SMC-Scp complex subunit ScpB [Azospirillum rugosum]|uniref:Segregation and condensation protein B n=1 Tax=Azospirillum rugosum TaxID=416170 RepID=A0ABS4SE06_9PROT|nr:SMC-Scp complex subunit ScpB [Azospirillum rugosum]MBP2290801.1 segregation and condensation protein B [Azospirillum rugosum]MDQ0529668.1 segregation and condensation protein B [Azospirillum rugosum]
MIQDIADPEALEARLHKLRLLEALLFASADPLDEETLAGRLGRDTDVADLLEELRAHYAPRGVNLVRTGAGWSFRTALDLAPLLRQEEEVSKKLSRAAIETLAIIAYHQPVTRAEIEAIRGVATSKGTLDILMENGWIRPGRRRETPGRPLTWVTTDHFLDHFGLESLRDLPGVEDLRAAGLLDSRPVLLGIAGGGADEPAESAETEDADG